MDLPALFVAKKFLSVVLLPPLMPWLCLLIGLGVMRARRRLGRILILLGFGFAWLFSTRGPVDWLARPLEDMPPVGAEALRHAQAIVILGAGQRRWLPEYGGPTPNWLGLERLRYGARLAKQSGLPVLVTGGAPTGEVAEASAMARVLVEDFGVPVRWIEDRALDTAGNARQSADILLPQGFRRIVLVTHAAHMRRARHEFAAVGFEVVPAPMGYLSGQGAEGEVFDFLPSPAAAYAGWIVSHEWLGLLAQRIRFLLY